MGDHGTKVMVDDEVWSTLQKLARRKSRGSALVAVPYCSDGTLPLKGGDTLIVDLSEATLKEGLTNPTTLEQYLKVGVDIYRSFGLHAKVYVFGSTAVVGSANMSASSMTRLREAAVLVREPATVRQIRDAIGIFADSEVSPADLRDAKKLYRAPRGGPRLPERPSKQHPAGRPPSQEDRLWLAGVDYTVPPAHVQAAYDQNQQRMLQKVGSATQVDLVCVFTYPDVVRGVRVDDLIIDVDVNDAGDFDPALGPSRVVELLPVPARGRGKERVLVYSRRPAGARAIPWSDLQEAARNVGSRLHLSYGFHRLTLPAVREALLKLW